MTPVYREERDAELAREGWSRRFSGPVNKMQDSIDLYESLGMEVLLDDLSALELAAECGDCALAVTFFKVLYTRRRPE